MPYYELEPEVAGGLGENTVMDTTVHPPRVSRLEYEIHGWFGADLIESFPCFLVSSDLAQALADTDLRVFELRDVEVTITPEAEDLRNKLNIRSFPHFQWLYVTGIAGQDDIGITSKASLVVSDRGLEFLRQFNLEGCDIEEYAG